MKKFVFTLIIFLKFLSFSIHASEVEIKYKVGNYIVTNLDIEKEIKYLTSLNNSLSELNDKQILDVASESIIREKIKILELKKYFEFRGKNEQLTKIYLDLGKKLKLNNENELNEYFKRFDLSQDEIIFKIEIESLWNQLIFEKYNSQVKINKNLIINKIKKLEKNKNIKEINLSEIVFQIKDQNNLDQKFNEIKKSILKIGFENTANLYSLSDSKSFGGKIGWINESNLSELIIKNIKDLKKDEVSSPINIGSNYIILKVNEVRQSEKKINKEKEFKKLELLERDKQLNKFSMIYFNKVKINTNVKKF